MPVKLNKKYGKLRVMSMSLVSIGYQGMRQTKCQVVCDCGNKSEVWAGGLMSGNSTSCGCTWREKVTKHGKCGTKTYQAWKAMNKRCTLKSYKQFKDYGGRGIKVCKRWQNSFENFYKDVGDIPKGMEIDRIDNDGDYTPSNVRVVTHKQNTRNRGTSRWWFINGKRYETASDAESELGIHHNTIRNWCLGRKRDGNFYPPKAGCSSELKYTLRQQ